jgi:flagellar hook-associated protein 1 FlgK
MRSTFHGLEIGKRAIFAQQTAMTITGHNIANVNTEGYTRQNAVVSASRPLSYPGMNNGTTPMQLGTGVEVSEINRVREQYLDGQFRSQNTQAGYWGAKSDTLSKIEGIINEPSDNGLQATLDQFWQSLEDLSKQPESLAARAVVRSRAQSVMEHFKQISSSIDGMVYQLENTLDVKKVEINSIAKQIAELNSQIAKLVPAGYQPNDLLDQRDLLLDRLSKLIEVQTQPMNNGAIQVSIGGQSLVSGDKAGTFDLDVTTSTASIDGTSVTLPVGEIYGFLESYGINQSGTMKGILPTFRSQINELAFTFITEINKVHAGSNAMNLDDISNRKSNPSAPLEQILFFVDKNDPTKAPTSIDDLALHPSILSSLNKIAAATSTNVGDGSNAKKMGDLKFEPLPFSTNKTTMNDFYRYIIGQLGTDAKEAQRMTENSEMLVSQIENRRESVSGVSIDEEMSNLVRFQQAYNAAARYVSAVDEVLDKLINGTGRVGM